MRSVALYTFLLAIITYILLKLFGEPLIADRLNLLQEMLSNGIAEGKIDDAQMKQQMDLANQIYSPYSQVLIVIMANLFVGFISSILAAVLVRK
jgi:flagellar biosynthesis protein FlhB